MNNSEYVSMVMKARNTMDYSDFVKVAIEPDQFTAIVDEVEKNTTKWGYAAGLLGEKKVEKTDGFSPKELEWKKYFQDHSFNSPEEQRNFCDAFSIVEDMDLNKFLKMIKPIKAVFPGYISIVPTGNSNSHDYKIGQPIFNFTKGTTFHKLTGSSGNQMTVKTNEYRLSSRDEIISIVGAVMYRIGSGVENLVYALLPRDSSQ